MNLNPRVDIPFFRKHAHALRISAALQVTALLLAAIVLDGGNLLKCVALGAAAYWIALAIIMLRRNGKPTPIDCLLLTWGFPLALLALVAAAMAAQMLDLH